MSSQVFAAGKKSPASLTISLRMFGSTVLVEAHSSWKSAVWTN